jgi:hypothetical protein
MSHLLGMIPEQTRPFASLGQAMCWDLWIEPGAMAVALPSRDEEFLFQFNIIKGRQDALVVQMANLVRETVDPLQFTPKSPAVLKLPGLRAGDLPFDQTVVLSPEASHAHATIPDLDRRTLSVFPANHCEFSGTETAPEAREVTRKYLLAADWTRAVSPHTRYRYCNVTTRSRSSGARFIVSDVVDALPYATRLKDPESFFELQNYQGQLCRVTWTPDGFRVTGATTLENADCNALTTILRAFLTEGVVGQ